MSMIDIGVNLCNDSFKNDMNEVLQRALDHDVTLMIITGTSESVSEKALDLANQYPKHLFSTAGIHPHDANQCNSNSCANLSRLLENDRVVAVGETGLDFNRDFSPRPTQIEVFEKQIELASETNKPLFIHERDAHQKMYEILKHHRDSITDGVIHCFTGEKDALFRYLDLNLHIGITGWICDERRGKTLAEIVHNIPLNRLMLETDAPYLIPRNLKDNADLPKPKSRRNEPCYLGHIASNIARCYNKEADEIKTATYQTTKRFFNISDTQQPLE